MINITIPEFSIVMEPHRTMGLPREPGIYAFFGDNNELLYIGKASNLFTRIRNHLTGNSDLCYLLHNIKQVKCFICTCPMKRELYEIYMINILKPAFNLDKVFLYNSKRTNECYYLPEDVENFKQEREAFMASLAEKVKQRSKN